MSPCPFCHQLAGFHDREVHNIIPIPKERILEKDWYKVPPVKQAVPATVSIIEGPIIPYHPGWQPGAGWPQEIPGWMLPIK